MAEEKAGKPAEAPKAAPTPAPAERASHAETVADELLSQEGLAQTRERMAKQARIDKGKEKIYDLVSSNVDTPHGELAVHYVKIALVYPLERLEKKIDTLTPDELQNEINRIIISAGGYLNELKNSGYQAMSAEKLAEAQQSARNKASNFSKLLAAHNDQLIEAFQASVGLQGKSGSVAANVEKAKKNLPAHIAKWLDQGEKLMPCIWMILGFMDSRDRVAIAASFVKSHPDKTEKFLDEGNNYGVFTVAEMERIRGKKYGNENKREQYAKTWETNNNFVKEGERLATEIYGSRNTANRAMTVGNAAVFIGKVAAVATVGLNVGVGMWKGEAWKSPAKMAAMMFENPYIVGGSAAFLALKEYDKGTSAEEYFADTNERAIETGRRSREYLETKLNGAYGERWRNFFRGQKFAGLQLFTHYAGQMEIAGRLTEDNFTTAGFLDFLDRAKASKNPLMEGVDIDAIKKSFQKIDDADLVALAHNLPLLNINSGKAGVDAYKKFLESINLT